MLVRDDGDSWTAIGQPAHAWLAAQLAMAWRQPLRPELLLAIAQHDIAWSESDLQPPLNAQERRAASFSEAPLDGRLERWRRVDRRLEAQSPYAALLVSLHATNIHTRYGNPERRPQEFLAQTRLAQEGLVDRLANDGVTQASAEADADLLFGFDAMSLALCLGRDDATVEWLDEQPMTVRRVADFDHTVDPWPFAPDELEVSLHAQVFHERFDDEVVMHRAIAAAPYERLAWRVRPA